MTGNRYNMRRLECVAFKLSALLFCFILFFCPFVSHSIDGADAAPTAEYEGAVTDGPYVFRYKKDVVVKHIMDDKVITKPYTITRTKYFVKILPFDREYVIPVKAPKVRPHTYNNVKKIFVMSDLHGCFTVFKRLLVNHGVIDNDMNWKWGKGHLVINGDVFDRGPEVTEILWAIHQLELQADAKGGGVHFVLGNHEIMVLQGDKRYLHPKYLRSGKLLNTSVMELYGRDTVLGQWLRTKHVMIRINDILFVHAGIHPLVLHKKLKINTINRLIRDNIDTPRASIYADEVLNFLFKKYGPLWYRGLVRATPEGRSPDPEVVDEMLKTFKVNHLVVGHSTQKRISSYYRQKVLAVDSGLQFCKGEALIWNDHDRRFSRALENGETLPLNMEQDKGEQEKGEQDKAVGDTNEYRAPDNK